MNIQIFSKTGINIVLIILVITGALIYQNSKAPEKESSIPYKETDSVRVLETRVSSHQGGSEILFEVFIKTDSGVQVEQIQLVDRQENRIVSTLEPGSVGFSDPVCGYYSDHIDFFGWTKYLTNSMLLPADAVDFFSPLPSDKYVVNVIYRDRTGDQYLTQKEIEGICDVMME